ncbi:MAG TPA: KTSC domain-containing protein [Terriglobales bacterium]|nr:KTSC domain-containing protein [Terriglobales bacterium]
MKRLPVDSSALRSIGYDPKSLVLEIEYINGSVYDYYGVPPAIYQEFCEADSMGAFVNFRIKPNFECHEVYRRTA